MKQYVMVEIMYIRVRARLRTERIRKIEHQGGLGSIDRALHRHMAIEEEVASLKRLVRAGRVFSRIEVPRAVLCFLNLRPRLKLKGTRFALVSHQ